MFAKKSLGQNFLKSKGAISAIIETAEIQPGETILEIGPGKGALTEKLLESGAKVTAIEKDSNLIVFLKEKFSDEIQDGKLKLICDDILDFNELEVKKDYKLIANIPYYITGLIIRKFLSSKNQPQKAVLLVQKEVSNRICASNKTISKKPCSQKESILSISVKIYGKPKIIKIVRAGSFVPVPKVDSAILLIDDINKKLFKDNRVDEKIFFDFVKAGFSHKRKILAKNLELVLKKYSVKKDRLLLAFKKIGLDPKTRAEDLSINDWLCLINIIFS